MSTNYDLKKALYNFLDIKLDSTNQITVNNSDKFKMIKVESGSIVNIFLTAEKTGSDASGIYINALSADVVNEYYSDFLIKIYWDGTDTIYILNDDANININSIFVEFLKGKLIETYLSSSTEDLSALTPEIIVDGTNINRINYRDESLTFTSEYNTLVNNFNSLNSNYIAWRATLGLYSQIDKLIPDLATETGKNKRISSFIANESIHSDLLIDGSILRSKLNSNVTDSLNLADSSVQSVKLNNGAELKDASKNVNINALTKLKIHDYNDSIESGEPIYREYDVDDSGMITIGDWSEYIQPKLSGVSGDLLYFSGDNTLSNININSFLLDSDILLNADGLGSADDVKVASSLLVKNNLDLKVNKINRTALNDMSLIKVTLSDQGLVTANTAVSQSDLTNIIGNYYLTVSYEFDELNGELKLL